MVDIILLSSRENPGAYNNYLNKYRFDFMPFSLLAAARLIPQNYNIKLIDTVINPNWKSELLKKLKKTPLCVGITCLGPQNILNTIQISRFIKKYSTTKIVVGGPAITFFNPEYFLKDDCIDVVVRGEGEITFYELINSFEKKTPLSKVKGISYKDKSKIKTNPSRPFLNLNKLPLPRYDLIDFKAYNNIVSFETSRGCTLNCSYCYNSITKTWRVLSPKKTIEFIEKILEDHNISRLKILDDDFTLDIDRTQKILKSWIQKKFNFSWGSQVGDNLIKNFDKEMLYLLEKSKCKVINYGLETGSPKLRMKMMPNRIHMGGIFRFNRKIKKADIKVKYNVIMCLPGETELDLKLTLKTVFKLKKENPNAEILGFGLFYPLPGTKACYEVIKKGFIPPQSPEEFARRYKTNISMLSPVLNIPERKLRFIHILSYFLGASDYTEFKPVSKLLVKAYRPIASYRFKKQFFDKNLLESFLLEKSIDSLFKNKIQRGD